MQAAYPMTVKLTPALRKDYESKWKSCQIDYQPETVKAVSAQLNGLVDRLEQELA